MLSFLFLLICLTGVLPEGFDAGSLCMEANAAEETVTLRVCNWEEYIDLGDWDEEETIELPLRRHHRREFHGGGISRNGITRPTEPG